MEPTELLHAAHAAAIAAAQPERVVPPYLNLPVSGRLRVVGAGKAAAAMAAAVEAHAPPGLRLDGLVVTRHGHGRPTHAIRVVEAGHPLPDAAVLQAAAEVLHLVASASPEDRLLALISGGGSSLLSLPAEGLALADIARVSGDLLASGAPIAEINCVRKHLTRTLGGRLAAVSRAPVTVLAISDVAGDDPVVIASGPFAPDPTTYHDAIEVLARWGVTPPAAVRAHLERGVRGELAETPKPSAACFARVEHRVIASGRTALTAAAEVFRAHGVHAVVLGDAIEGEAREVAAVFAALAREVRLYGTPWAPPVVLLSGGETTVTIRGGVRPGRGGRNSECLLGAALALAGMPGVWGLMADTDGIDGEGEAAGAIAAPDTLARARAAGRDPRAALDAHDSGGLFAALGDAVVTGPTLTNVNDFRALLVA